jgi:hypothetical protein
MDKVPPQTRSEAGGIAGPSFQTLPEEPSVKPRSGKIFKNLSLFYNTIISTAK